MSIKKNIIEFAKNFLINIPGFSPFYKKLRRKISPNIFSTVVSYEQAAAYTKLLTKEIPNEFDLVIGVPRSGLFIASIIATKFARPLSTPDLF